jgi:hypothetical protein
MFTKKIKRNDQPNRSMLTPRRQTTDPQGFDNAICANRGAPLDPGEAPSDLR